MSRCTAPVKGHHSASAAANCPACRYKSLGYRPYYDRISTLSSSSNSPSLPVGNYNSIRGRVRKPYWSNSSSPIYYTSAEIYTLTPFRENIVKRATNEDLRDVFLCHAWDDRRGVAKELHDSLESEGISVWFSEKDVLLGTSLMREIDKGLAKSKIGIVLVTPNFLNRINNEGIADKELSALLARDLLIPIMHGTNFEALREISPLLGSRSGMSTSEDTISTICSKLSELIGVRKL